MYYVAFYQHPNSGGICVRLGVNDVGDAIPIDEFEKYHLQDQITEIHYNLPVNRGLVLFTGRFFHMTDGDLGRFLNNSAALRQIIERTTGVNIGQLGESALLLKGTGQNVVVPLHLVENGKYDDKIRSARIIPIG